MKCFAILTSLSFVIGTGCGMSETGSNGSPAGEASGPQPGDDLSQWPSAQEGKVRYNVPKHPPEYEDEEDEEMDDFIYPEPGDAYKYVSTAPHPPIIDDDWEIIAELYEPFVGSLKKIGYPEINEFGVRTTKLIVIYGNRAGTTVWSAFAKRAAALRRGIARFLCGHRTRT